MASNPPSSAGRAANAPPAAGKIPAEKRPGSRTRSSEGGGLPALDRSGGGRVWIILGVILLLAAALRGLYLTELVRQPDFRSPTADAAFHDYWARGLVYKDWTPPAGNADPHVNQNPFMRPPGYPYFLAFLYALTGGSYLSARIAQMILGLVNVFLLFLLARSLLGRAGGLVAAALAAIYWGFIFYEGELQAPVLSIFTLLLMFLALRAWRRAPSFFWGAIAGLLLGISGLERPNVMVFLPVAALWMWWVLRSRGHGAGIRQAAAFTVATFVAIAPAAVRNLVVGHDHVLISSNGPVNLYIGNNDLADGHSLKIPDLYELSGHTSWSMFNYDDIAQGISRQVGHPLKHSAVASWFSSRAMEYIRAHPGRFLRLTARRAALFWGPQEVSNNKAGEFEKGASRALRFLPSFPVVYSLGLLGAGLFLLERRRARKGRRLPPDGAQARAVGLHGREAAAAEPLSRDASDLLWLIAVFVIVYFVSFLPFIVADRFRLPIIPFLILFGALGILRTGRHLAEKRRPLAVGAIGAWVALLGLCHLSLAQYKPEKAWWHTDRGLAYQRLGKMKEANEEFFAAVKANPGYVDGRLSLAEGLIKAGRVSEAVPHLQDVAVNRPTRIDVRLRLAEVLLDQHRNQEAATELQGLTRDYPDEPDAQRMLAAALIQLGRKDQALQAAQQALALKQGNAGAYLALGNTFHALAAETEAEACYRRALELDPKNVESTVNLGNVRFREHKVDEAIRWYQKAVDMDPKNPTARVNLAGAQFTKGDLVSATREAQEVLRIDPTNVPAQRLLGLIRNSNRPAPPR